METFINLYENQLDCVGKKDLDDALGYFSAKVAAKILECEVEELMEFSTESIDGEKLHNDIINDGKFIRKTEDEFETGTLFVYEYKGVVFVLNRLDDISGGLVREKDIPKISYKDGIKGVSEFEKKYPQIKLSSDLKGEMKSQGFTIKKEILVVIETPYADYPFNKVSGKQLPWQAK